MSTMTIKMKMAQDELVLSGMQVSTITPVPASTALVQETSATGKRSARTEARKSAGTTP